MEKYVINHDEVVVANNLIFSETYKYAEIAARDAFEYYWRTKGKKFSNVRFGIKRVKIENFYLHKIFVRSSYFCPNAKVKVKSYWTIGMKFRKLFIMYFENYLDRFLL